MSANSTSRRRRTAGWILALGVLGLAAPGTVSAQEGEKPGVVEEDLGDGFRAVSVGGGPPAIFDDATGMILKQAFGRAVIYDSETGATLYLDDDGAPVVKYKGDPQREGGNAEHAKRLERMKTFMKRAQTYGQERKGTPAEGGAGEGKKGKAEKNPALTWDALVAAHMQLLAADEETKLVLEPLVRAVLLKLDEIRRSTAPASPPGAKAAPVLPGSLALPAAISDYLRAFANQEGKKLEAGLAAYRAARGEQDAELARRREALRALLTVSQEAKLVAAGVLN